jgi:hypothetical protein
MGGASPVCGSRALAGSVLQPASRAVILRSMDELARFMASYAEAWNTGDLLAGNQRQGPHTWAFAELDPRPMGRDAAMVTVRWVCRRLDGSTIWEFLDSHLLAPDQGQWRILGDVVHA